MDLRFVLVLLAIVACCIEAQNANAQGTPSAQNAGNQNGGNQNAGTANAEALAVQQAVTMPFEVTGRGRGGNQQNANCLARCMNLGVQTSQRVLRNEFQDTCRQYRQVANCYENCGGKNWDSIADDMTSYCKEQDDISDRFNRCYDRWLDQSYNGCLNQCSRGSTNWLRSNNWSSYCQTLHCFMPCLINRLNDRCSRSGYALANLYYTPYVVAYESQFLYPFYIQALRQVPNSCGLFYVGNLLRSGDGADDGSQWTFVLPNDTMTAQ